jgi:hypothetical protein
VTILVRGVAAGTCTVTEATNSCSITAAANAFIVGANAITATFAGATGSGYAASTSAPVTVTVAKATVAPVVTTSLATSGYGTTVTYSATVTGLIAAATGTVTFTTLVGAVTTTLGTCTLAAQTCSITYNALAIGAYTVTASYAGDGNYNLATGTVAQTVVKGTPTVAIVTTPAGGAASATIQIGQQFTVKTTVSAPLGTATGAITVNALNTGTNVTTLLGTCTLAAGTCTVTVTANKIPVGNYTITSTYAGDTLFNTTANTPFAFTVTKVIRTLTVTSSAASATNGTNITFTGAVAVVAGTTNATGVLTFTTLVNSVLTTIGTCTLSAVASCSVSKANLPAGTYVITASYPGDANYGATTGTFTQTVTKIVTPITLTVPVTTIKAGLTATIVVKLNAAAATGTVNIMNGTTLLGTCALVVSGTTTTCTFITPALVAGTYNITAVYSGNATYATVTSTVGKFTVR